MIENAICSDPYQNGKWLTNPTEHQIEEAIQAAINYGMPRMSHLWLNRFYYDEKDPSTKYNNDDDVSIAMGIGALENWNGISDDFDDDMCCFIHRVSPELPNGGSILVWNPESTDDRTVTIEDVGGASWTFRAANCAPIQFAFDFTKRLFSEGYVGDDLTWE